MNNVFLIIQREYLSRVKKKSFIIMTFLTPVLFALIMFLPILIMKYSKSTDVKIIAVIDSKNIIQKALKNTDEVQFVYIDKTIEQIKPEIGKKYFGAIECQNKSDFFFLTSKQVPIQMKQDICSTINEKLKNLKIVELNLPEDIVKQLDVNVNLNISVIDGQGKEKKTSTELISVLGFIFAFVIYIFIFAYGAMVMRGVLEEKTNRIVEIIVSSVKPFHLMMGKIIGVACVALTQIVAWVVLTTALTMVFSLISIGTIDYSEAMQQTGGGMSISILEGISSIPWTFILVAFVFYFFGGYLLYTSLFAAIGAAVDNETDTQQFMMPISLPLIVGLMISQAVIQNPSSSAAFWGSMIPFTSPIVMLVRIPFGVETWELVLSISLLFVGFIFTTFIASKIYKIGIISYGKKITYGELWKWIKYS